LFCYLLLGDIKEDVRVSIELIWLRVGTRCRLLWTW